MSLARSTLREFGRLARLSRGEDAMLSEIGLAGRPPETVAGWQMLFDAIRLVCAREEFRRPDRRQK